MGTVLSVERVRKSRKLVRIQVDLGYEKRQILAGVAKHFDPASLVGRRVVAVANLQPRKMMGHQSQGMLLMAEGPGRASGRCDRRRRRRCRGPVAGGSGV